jgi:predicted nucleic acid-binding protein
LAQYFFDSRALVKYYHAEIGSDCVAAIFAEPDRKIRISRIGLVEIQSAIAMKVRSGALKQAAAELQRQRLLLDVADSALEVYKVTEEHFSMAERLVARHSFSSRLRTLDAIQLAVALDLAEQQLSDQFVVADRVLAEMAAIESLQILNPEL